VAVPSLQRLVLSRRSYSGAPLLTKLAAAAGQLLRRHRKTVAFLHDAAVASAAFGIASTLRLADDVVAPQYVPTLITTSLAFTTIAVPVFYLCRLHRQTWRYASLTDLVMIIKAVTLAVLVLLLAMFMVNRLDNVPRSVPVIQWGVLIILLGGPRFADCWLRARWSDWTSGKSRLRSIPVLVLGTGDEAQLFLRAIVTGYAPLYRAVGVLDTSDELVGRSIHGVPVLGQVTDLPAVLARLAKRRLKPQRLIVTNAAERLDGAAKVELFERAHQFGLTLARLPRLTEFKQADGGDPSGGGRIGLQPIALEDLLGRPQVALDRRAIANLIRGRRVLITGAGGSIGSELTRQIAAFEPAQLLLVEFNEFNLYRIDLELGELALRVPTVPLLCNVCDRERVSQTFARYRPEVVFHAAAFKHVPLIEANPGEGVLTNTIGTRNVADAACAHRATAMVLISTDKAVNPTSSMGASKRLAEHYCQALDLAARPPGAAGTRFLTVRFGNVLGSSGSVVPLFQRQLARGGPLTVTHPEIKRYFMTIPEAVGLILQASTYGLAHAEERGRILVLDMGEPIRIADIAAQVIRLAGHEPDRDIKIEFTGLRPGEKLHEELFDATEVPVQTSAPGVLAAMPQPIEFGRLRAALDRLEEAARRQDVAVMEHVFGDLVGGFRQSERVA
jgi:O-antigen biosynthesis protein WbqV